MTGWFRLVFWGVLAPVAIAGFAVRSWITEEAIWFSMARRAESFDLTGQAARYMAFAYLCAGLVLHLRYCWSPLGFERTSRVGTAIALYLGIGALLAALGFAMAGE